MHDGVEAAHGGGERARACPVAAQKFWRGAAAVARHLGDGGATALLGAAGVSRADAAGAADDEDALLHGGADCGREEREHRGRVGGGDRWPRWSDDGGASCEREAVAKGARGCMAAGASRRRANRDARAPGARRAPRRRLGVVAGARCARTRRGRRTGKCCNPGRQLKRKQIVFRQKWRECGGESEPATECDNEPSATRSVDAPLTAAECADAEKDQLLGDPRPASADRRQGAADRRQGAVDREPRRLHAREGRRGSLRCHVGVRAGIVLRTLCMVARLFPIQADRLHSFEFEFANAVESGTITQPCPGQFVSSAACTQFQQAYTCYGAKCGSLWYAGSEDCNDFVCTAEDIKCAMFRTRRRARFAR